MGGLVHVVLDEHAVLEHGDLGPVILLPDDHDPVHGFAPGQELGLGDDRRAPAPGLAALAPPLPLGLQAGRAADRPDVADGHGLVGVLRARHPHMHDSVGRIVGGGLPVSG